jgi:hypothetical protein
MDNPWLQSAPNPNFKDMKKYFKYLCRYWKSESNYMRMRCRIWDWWNPANMDYPIIEHGLSDAYNRIIWIF